MDHRDLAAWHRRRALEKMRERAEQARPCSTRQEGDEYVCHCGLRWDTHEDRPACPQGSK